VEIPAATVPFVSAMACSFQKHPSSLECLDPSEGNACVVGKQQSLTIDAAMTIIMRNEPTRNIAVA